MEENETKVKLGCPGESVNITEQEGGAMEAIGEERAGGRKEQCDHIVRIKYWVVTCM